MGIFCYLSVFLPENRRFEGSERDSILGLLEQAIESRHGQRRVQSMRFTLIRLGFLVFPGACLNSVKMFDCVSVRHPQPRTLNTLNSWNGGPFRVRVAKYDMLGFLYETHALMF